MPRSRICVLLARGRSPDSDRGTDDPRAAAAAPRLALFRHTAENPLPYDVVIVDEASMVDCALMAKLLDAVPPGSRIILIGDKDQLASVEAGSLLADLCGTGENRYSEELATRYRKHHSRIQLAAGAVPPIADSIVTLQTNYRFGNGSGIGEASAAINRGDSKATVSILKDGPFSDCTFWTPPSYQALLDRLRQRL